jgi:hypothetical protein
MGETPDVGRIYAASWIWVSEKTTSRQFVNKASSLVSLSSVLDSFAVSGHGQTNVTIGGRHVEPDGERSRSMTTNGIVPNYIYLPTQEFASKVQSARFDGGYLIISPPAKELLKRYGVDPYQLLERHCSGEWGQQSEEDKKAWDRALKKGLSLMSVYEVGGSEVWLMTDVERLNTTLVLLEED